MVVRRIYAMLDADECVRYVGKTSKLSVEARYADHLRTAARVDPRARRLPVHRWLAKHRDEARVIELESGEWSVAELNARERAWIAYFGLETLLNVTAGGDGGLIPGNAADIPYVRTPEFREKLSKAISAGMLARTPEQKRASALKMLETRRAQAMYTSTNV